MTRNQRGGAATIFGAAVVLMLAMQVAERLDLRAQTGPQDKAGAIVSSRPLADVSLLLEERYAKPITFEEPVWAWRGDVEVKGEDENAYMAQWLKGRRFELPEGLNPQQTPTLNAALLEKVLGAYHSQNGDGTRFKVLESRMGLHIVPAQYHDANGQVVASASVLDARVAVPGAVRMASDHFLAVCAAVTAATGTKVDLNSPWLDMYFAANATVPPNGAAQLLPEQEKAKYSFAWGAPEMPAREALLSLLDNSATTLRWSLLCHPSAKPGDRFCVLNLGPVQVRETGADGKSTLKSLSYDRRVKPSFGAPIPPAK